jgi:DNA-binding NarL/FixJ family response regulator
MSHTVVIVVSDLMFQTRIDRALAALGVEAQVADSAERLDRAFATPPAAVVVDLQEPALDAVAVIRRAKAGRARVLAFGRHTEAAALRAARAAGADIVVPRSALSQDLASLMVRLVGAATEV